MTGECLYKILSIEQSATDIEIKKAYRTAALASHPDKNPGREAEAAGNFQKVQHAYSVLSDPHERAWYDSHRNQILRNGGTFSNGGPEKSAEAEDATNVDLFACFSSAAYQGFTDEKEGFYGFYGGVFDQLWAEEVEAMQRDEKYAGIGVSFGDMDAGWETVRAFYAFWDAFGSAKTFAFADKWNLAEAPNRDVRRLMEKENKKERAKVRKEFNGTLQELVAFVKKRDPRVKRRRKEEEVERVKKEGERAEREKERIRAKKEGAKESKLMREQALEEDGEALDEILRNIEIDEQIEKREKRRRRRAEAKGNSDLDKETNNETSNAEDNERVCDLDDEDLRHAAEMVEADDDSSGEEIDEDDLYCAACRKPFRTPAQKADHERSKKHRVAVSKLKKQLLKEEKAFEKAQSGPPVFSETTKEEERYHNDEDYLEKEGLESKVGEGSVDVASTSKKKKKQTKQRAKALAKEAAVLDVDETQNTEEGSGDKPNLDENSKDEAGDRKSELSKKQKRKLREERKKQQATYRGKVLNCNVCKAPFPSRNLLMRHVESSGHALRVPP